MRIIVFGANGKVGSLVVETLLTKAYDVTAFVHGDHSFRKNDKLEVHEGSIKNADDVSAALKGCGSVISTLGSWGTETKDILSQGMRTIVPAMKQHRVMRIVSLTGSAAHVPGDNWGTGAVVARRLFGLAAPKILADAEEHVRLLMDSDLAWTVLRSPVMNNAEYSTYTLNNEVPSLFETISRRAVAQAIVAQLEDSSFYGQAPHIHRDR